MKGSSVISREQARSLALQSQGLLNPAFGKGKKGALRAIEQLGYVQIDTLSVVSRAHHHTLWSRVPGYREKFLHELLDEKTIFEYWSHAASYLPMKDFRFTLQQKKMYEKGRDHWFPQDKKVKKYVLDRISSEGPLQSRDFEFIRSVPGNWYEWKPAKQALEQLFMEGRLMVVKRDGFRKVYDLTERVLPKNVDISMPDPDEQAAFLINRRLNAHGLTEEREISYLLKHSRAPIGKVLGHMLGDGKLIEINVEDVKGKYLTTEAHLHLLKKIRNTNKLVHLLSPFDNVVIQRKRLQNLFLFDYMVECYVPEAKRKYGYFVLPLLYGNMFVGRLDPKADRAEGVFYIKEIFFEKNFLPDEEFNTSFAGVLRRFAEFNGCRTIRIVKANGKWKRQMEAILKVQESV